VNVHEYQAKGLLREFGVEVPPGKLARTPQEAEAAARALGGTIVVKAQVHAGGRGKAGGIKVVKTPGDAGRVAGEIIGMRLITPQTGAAGKLVRKVYVEEGSKIDRELYLALLVDRATRNIALVASTEGGMEIEEVAAHHPEKILNVQIDPLVGVCEYQARDLAADLQLKGAQIGAFVKLVQSLYTMFRAKDCSMIEINPLIVSGDSVMPLDCKLGFDDNALFRHPDIRAMRDADEEDPREAEAAEHDLSWVSLDGNIGCMVNGAGLAMATMDIIKLQGANPANFLDVGGTADANRVAEAFRLILQDKNVKGILVNIFGGIVRCDLVAEGVIEATQRMKVEVPIVVRLDGTNAEEARRMLAGSGLSITPATGMKDAAEKIVAAVQAS
jgi:succinyl-CoA synthetase beta subunit